MMFINDRFRGNYWYVKLNTNNEISDSIKFTVTQKRLPKINDGDRVIVLSNGYFIKHGIVQSTPIMEDTDGLIEQKEYTYKMGEFVPIDTPNDLRGFTYSLPKIWKHYNKPELHFKRSYGRLSELDYDVITNHNYFISRTAFGRIINSLHPVHRHAFVNESILIKENIGIAEDFDYVELLHNLKDYINDNIISHTRMLKEAHSILETNFNIGSELGFINPSDNSYRAYIIKKQIKEIEDGEAYLSKSLSFDEIFKEITNFWQVERKKSKQFRNKWLPINF